MSCNSCYICLSSKRTLIKPDCLCKTMLVHRSCFTKWLSTSPDFITCPVCKDTFNPSFLVSFVGVEALMKYSDKREDSEEDEEENYEFELNVPGLPPTIYQDDDGTLYFDSIDQLNTYMESEKRNILSFKKNKKFQYKSPFYQKHSQQHRSSISKKVRM